MWTHLAKGLNVMDVHSHVKVPHCRFNYCVAKNISLKRTEVAWSMKNQKSDTETVPGKKKRRRGQTNLDCYGGSHLEHFTVNQYFTSKTLQQHINGDEWTHVVYYGHKYTKNMVMVICLDTDVNMSHRLAGFSMNWHSFPFFLPERRFFQESTHGLEWPLISFPLRSDF